MSKTLTDYIVIYLEALDHFLCGLWRYLHCKQVRHILFRVFPLGLTYSPSLVLPFLWNTLRGRPNVKLWRPLAWQPIRDFAHRAMVRGRAKNAVEYPDAMAALSRTLGLRLDQLQDRIYVAMTQIQHEKSA